VGEDSDWPSAGLGEPWVSSWVSPVREAGLGEPWFMAASPCSCVDGQHAACLQAARQSRTGHCAWVPAAVECPHSFGSSICVVADANGAHRESSTSVHFGPIVELVHGLRSDLCMHALSHGPGLDATLISDPSS